MCLLDTICRAKILPLELENKELKSQLSSQEQTISNLKKEIEELENSVSKLPPNPPAIRGKISSSQIINLYSSIFPKDKDKIFVSDEQYEITAISEIRRFVEWDNVNIFPYTPEYHDCDDFAMALAGDFAKYPGWSGLPVTFIWGSYAGGHAFCTAIAWPSFDDRTPTVYYIEPQSDQEIGYESVEGTDLWLLPMRKVSVT